MVTRAVHFELAMNMTGEEFARVFEAFCNSRNVIPETIVSDNGSNFTPIINFIREKWINSTDNRYRKIIWKTLPRHAPTWGGFYERLVGVFKDRMIREFPRLIFSNLLEAQSALKRIENRMNQRPLGTVDMDRDNTAVITPTSFLVVAPSGNLGQPTYDSITGLANLYKEQQKTIDLIWHRFYLSYLVTLRLHHKWDKRKVIDLQVGDLVLIHADKIKARSKWPIGRIRAIIYDARNQKPKAAYVDEYSPTTMNRPLKNRLHGVRMAYKNLTVEQRIRVTGCFKKATNSTPIAQLYPYEMWRAKPMSLTLSAPDNDKDKDPPTKRPRIDSNVIQGPILPDVVDVEEVEFVDEEGVTQIASSSLYRN
jgi:hypothetical protein